jgi:hypothetical protein
MITQSPVLRQKIGPLAPESVKGSGLGSVLDELHRRIQVLLLRSGWGQKIKTYHPRANPSVPNAFTLNDFTDYASLDPFRECLHGHEDSQLHEAMSDFVEHGLMGLEPESSHALATHGRDSDGIDLEAYEHYVDHEMEAAEGTDHGVMSCASQNLLKFGGLYSENGVDDETIDLTDEDREHQKQLLAAAQAIHEYEKEKAGFYGENNSHGHHYERSDIEERLGITTGAFKDHCLGPVRAAGTWEKLRADLSDFVADEDDVIGGGLVNYFREGVDADKSQYDPCEPNEDHDQGAMVRGFDIDDKLGPNYTTRGHGHHNHQAEAADEGYMEVGSSRAFHDWSQVPRDYAHHDTGERWAHPWAHRAPWTGG